MDSNTFELIGAPITGITYIDGSFAITAGEEFALPPTFSNEGSTWFMNVEADRSNSAPVAQSFNAITGGPGHQFADSFVDKSPEELNFYFGTVVTFSIGGASIPVTLYFGQGHRFASNNWWIGGEAVQSGDARGPVLVVSNGTIQAVFGIQAQTSAMTLVPV